MSCSTKNISKWYCREGCLCHPAMGVVYMGHCLLLHSTSLSCSALCKVPPKFTVSVISPRMFSDYPEGNFSTTFSPLSPRTWLRRRWLWFSNTKFLQWPHHLTGCFSTTFFLIKISYFFSSKMLSEPFSLKYAKFVHVRSVWKIEVYLCSAKMY